jgi:hypothetical protein
MYFKCVLIFETSQSDYVLALPMGIYVGTKTSFILGFATDLCVVFGPCHKDNVAVVTKIV